jgi:hypothetical protein
MQNQKRYWKSGVVPTRAFPAVGVSFCAVLLGLSISPSLAHAQGALPPGSFIIGGERLISVGAETLTTEQSQAGVTDTDTIESTAVSLLGQGRLAISGFGPSLLPRVGLDGVLGPGVTLGGSVFYTRTSGETENETSSAGLSTSTKNDAPTIGWFVIHPRIGYALALGDQFALWPRAGITYSSITATTESELTVDGVVTDVETESTFSTTNFSLEVLVAASPVPHTAIVFGPFLDLPLGGSSETERTPSDPTFTNPDDDVSYTAYGLVAGLALVL